MFPSQPKMGEVSEETAGERSGDLTCVTVPASVRWELRVLRYPVKFVKRWAVGKSNATIVSKPIVVERGNPLTALILQCCCEAAVL